MVRVYKDALAGTVPQFPREMEDRIDAYLATSTAPAAAIADRGRERASIGSADGSRRNNRLVARPHDASGVSTWGRTRLRADWRAYTSG